MLSFLFGAKAPIPAQRRFLLLTDAFGHPILINVDAIDVVHVRTDRDGVHIGAVIEIGESMTTVNEKFRDIVEAMTQEAVPHV